MFLVYETSLLHIEKSISLEIRNIYSGTKITKVKKKNQDQKISPQFLFMTKFSINKNSSLVCSDNKIKNFLEIKFKIQKTREYKRVKLFSVECMYL